MRHSGKESHIETACHLLDGVRHEIVEFGGQRAEVRRYGAEQAEDGVPALIDGMRPERGTEGGKGRQGGQGWVISLKGPLLDTRGCYAMGGSDSIDQNN